MSTTATGRRRSLALGAGAMVLGGLTIVVAPILPWIEGSSAARGTASVSGFEAGRAVQIALVAGLLAVLLGVMLAMGVGPWRPPVQLGVVLAVAAAVVGWIAYRDASDPAVSFLVSRDETQATYAPGAGVWALFLGAALVLAGSVTYGLLRGGADRRERSVR